MGKHGVASEGCLDPWSRGAPGLVGSSLQGNIADLGVVATRGLGVCPAFDFLWAWSSGTVADAGIEELVLVSLRG